MNRRGFLGALASAPFAALAAPAVAKPVLASGGYIKPKYVGVIGEMAGESILPLSTATRIWPKFGIPYDVAMKGFDVALADGDITEDGELVEVEIANPSPAAS